MSNKNQRRVRNLIKQAFHKKESEVRIQVPSQNYHNNKSGTWQTRNIPLIAYKPKAKSKPFPKGSSDGMSILEQRKFLSY